MACPHLVITPERTGIEAEYARYKAGARHTQGRAQRAATHHLFPSGS
jgi:hypothetical protein